MRGRRGCSGALTVLVPGSVRDSAMVATRQQRRADAADPKQVARHAVKQRRGAGTVATRAGLGKFCQLGARASGYPLNFVCDGGLSEWG